MPGIFAVDKQKEGEYLLLKISKKDHAASSSYMAELGTENRSVIGDGARRPNVSVGLPVYNGGEMLKEAIGSILSQDYQDMELVISDNGSTDSTREVCLEYQKKDDRIRYYRLHRNMGWVKNFWNAFARSRGPYFMWATHDDLREKSFITKCLEKIQSDPDIALVYPQSKVYDADSNFLGIAKDYLDTGQDNPIERFKHLIWELGMCNVFYGLYRREAIEKTRSFLFYKIYCGYDNLFLAEISLLGKIIQIPEPLFGRRLTRKYDDSMEEHNAIVIEEDDPPKIRDGITFPFLGLAYAHLDLINYMVDSKADRNDLMNEVIKCYKTLYGNNMMVEIKRAISLVSDNCFYYNWDHRYMDGAPDPNGGKVRSFYHLNNLIKNLQEACFIYPELTELRQAHEKCLQKMHEYYNAFVMAGLSR